MKLIFRIALVLSTVSAMLLTSCTPDTAENTDELKDITASAPDALEITAANAAEELLQVTWTDNSVYADPVTYAVSLSLKGGSPEDVYEATDATSPWKYTGAALQSLLVTEWGVAEEEDAVLNIAVNAVRDGKIVNSSAALEVSVVVKTAVKPLVLSVDPLTVNLAEESAEESAVTFSWTDENEYTASYRLTLNAGSEKYEVEGLAEKTLSFTHEAFNQIAREALGLAARVSSTVEATVVSYDSNGVLASSAAKAFDVTPYGSITEYSALAIFGTATAAGDDPAKAFAMTKGEGSVFTWRGELEKGGTVRILVEPDGDAKDFIVPSEDGKEIVSGLVENLDVAQSGYAWTVPVWGVYEVTVDLGERTVVFGEVTRKYSNIGMVGPATPNEWDAVNPTLLTTEDYTVFTWEGNLRNGTMRFLNNPSAAGWEVDQYIASSADLEVVSGETMKLVLAALNTPRGDNMWKITNQGTYRITLNVDEMTVVFDRIGDMTIPDFENVKLVGPASPGGWDAAAMSPMEKDGEGWKWTGHLNSGELKFVCNQNGSDWGTTQLYAQVNGQGVSEFEGLEYPCNVGGDDNKWNIRYSGEYIIEISKYGKVKFTIISLDPVPDQSADVLAENYPSLGLIGGAAPNGWDQSYAASTLLPDGAGIYRWEGPLKADGLHIMCDVTKTDWTSPRLTAPFGGIVAKSGTPLPMVWQKNDTNWNIPEQGVYSVVVDLNAMTVTFTLVTR